MPFFDLHEGILGEFAERAAVALEDYEVPLMGLAFLNLGDKAEGMRELRKDPAYRAKEVAYQARPEIRARRAAAEKARYAARKAG